KIQHILIISFLEMFERKGCRYRVFSSLLRRSPLSQPVLSIYNFLMKTQFLNWWTSQHPTTQSLLHHLWLAGVNFYRHGTRQAAALAYYAIFSIFPLFLLLVVAISNVVNPALASEQIGNGLRLFLPTGMVSPLENDVAAALNQAQSFGIVALAG